MVPPEAYTMDLRLRLDNIIHLLPFGLEYVRDTPPIERADCNTAEAEFLGCPPLEESHALKPVNLQAAAVSAPRLNNELKWNVAPSHQLTYARRFMQHYCRCRAPASEREGPSSL